MPTCPLAGDVTEFDDTVAVVATTVASITTGIVQFQVV